MVRILFNPVGYLRVFKEQHFINHRNPKTDALQSTFIVKCNTSAKTDALFLIICKSLPPYRLKIYPARNTSLISAGHTSTPSRQMCVSFLTVQFFPICIKCSVVKQHPFDNIKLSGMFRNKFLCRMHGNPCRFL